MRDCGFCCACCGSCPPPNGDEGEDLPVWLSLLFSTFIIVIGSCAVAGFLIP